MNATTWVVRALIFAMLAASCLHARTLEEDEAHIAELIRAELAAVPPPATGPAVTPEPTPAQPAPVIAEVIAPAPSPPPPPKDDWLAPPAAQEQGLPFGELAQFLGRKVTVVTAGGRVHRGTVSAANAREVTLQVRRAGGDASYTLQRQQIVRIEPR